MQPKKLTIRFNLDNPDERKAWVYLQGIKDISKNKAVLSIINQAERSNRIEKMFRRIVQEEIVTAMKKVPSQPVQMEQTEDNGADATIMEFLDSFM